MLHAFRDVQVLLPFWGHKLPSPGHTDTGAGSRQHAFALTAFCPCRCWPGRCRWPLDARVRGGGGGARRMAECGLRHPVLPPVQHWRKCRDGGTATFFHTALTPLLPGLKVQQSNGPVAGQTVPQLHFHVIPCYAPQPSSPTATGSSCGSGVAAPEATEPAEVTASERPALCESMAGPLVARLRNLFVPLGYGRPNSFHAWAGTAEEMERLGASMQVWTGGVAAVVCCKPACNLHDSLTVSVSVV